MDEDKQGYEPSITMPVFRIWLCGTFRVERYVDGHYVPIRTAEWGGSSYPRLLLKALLSCPGSCARREALIEMLWPELDFEQAVQNLNTAATKLRSVLRLVNGRESLLLAEDTSYALAYRSLLWVDSDVSFELLKRAEHIGHSTPEAVLLLEEATSYFNRGLFLEGKRGFGP